jgi:hypothetical protein
MVAIGAWFASAANGSPGESTKIKTWFAFDASSAQPSTPVALATHPLAPTGTNSSTPGSSTAHVVVVQASVYVTAGWHTPPFGHSESTVHGAPLFVPPRQALTSFTVTFVPGGFDDEEFVNVTSMSTVWSTASAVAHVVPVDGKSGSEPLA